MKLLQVFAGLSCFVLAAVLDRKAFNQPRRFHLMPTLIPGSSDLSQGGTLSIGEVVLSLLPGLILSDLIKVANLDEPACLFLLDHKPNRFGSPALGG